MKLFLLCLQKVKTKSHILKHYPFLPVFGLIMLLLVAPCKVRNFIQTELGSPQTEVSNKSQTTVTNLDCPTFAFDNVQSNQNPTLHQPNISFLATSQFVYGADLVDHIDVLPLLESPSVSNIPLYILYQNLTVYS